jgi:peptidoglycan/LPS O-acetylase OafA/YrhL
MNSKQSAYRPEIDGLRAIAVVAVIINHFNKDILPGGYLGVDIFFVISGYVITSSLSMRRGNTLGHLLLEFYTRRLKRLAPALVTCVLITGILLCLFNPTPRDSLLTGITALFGLSNFHLYLQATNYFAGSSLYDAFMHTWSLGVEEQFYFIFPMILWFSGFIEWGHNKPRTLNTSLFILIALSAASLAIFAYLNRTNPPAGFFLMPPRFWELGSGSIMFILLASHASLARLLRSLPSLIPLAIILLLLYTGTKTVGYIGIVFATAILIGSLKPGKIEYSMLTNYWFLYIGTISYSLYLWHWSVLCLSRWTVGIHAWSVPIQLLLMLGLASASYRWIEQPLRNQEWSVHRWTTLAYGLISALISSTVLLGLGWLKPFSLFTGDRAAEFAQQGVGSIRDDYTLLATGSTWKGINCTLKDNDAVGRNINFKDCILGDFSKASRRVLVVGNSFSAPFIRAFDDLVAKDGYAVALTSAFGSGPTEQTIPGNKGYDKSHQYYWSQVIPSQMSQLKKGDWLFLIDDLSNFSPSKRMPVGDAVIKKLHVEFSQFAKKLNKKGIKLAVLHAIPFARDAQCPPIVASDQWYNSLSNSCIFFSRKQTLARRASLDSMFKDLQKTGNFTVVDLLDIFCPGLVCNYNANDGTVLYRDEFSHPSEAAVRLSAPLIRKILTNKDS